jgi:hypothetical protein
MRHESTHGTEEQVVDPRKLGQRFSEFRLVRPDVVRQMQRSLYHNGQLTPLWVWAEPDSSLQLVDGFKRQQAACALQWPTVRVCELGQIGQADAKLSLALLNAGGCLSELEEAWLVQSLYRQDKLNQPQIGRLWGRTKSWVCRRLALAEGLDEAVVADVRLGLLPARTASEIARLPRGNQSAISQMAIRRGMTCAQVSRLVGEVLKCPDAESIDRLLARRQQMEPSSPAAGRPRRRTALQQVLSDIEQVCRLSARLHGLVGQPATWASSDGGTEMALGAMTDCVAVLSALSGTLQRCVQQHRPSQMGLPHQGETR